MLKLIIITFASAIILFLTILGLKDFKYSFKKKKCDKWIQKYPFLYLKFKNKRACVSYEEITEWIVSLKRHDERELIDNNHVLCDQFINSFYNDRKEDPSYIRAFSEYTGLAEENIIFKLYNGELFSEYWFFKMNFKKDYLNKLLSVCPNGLQHFCELHNIQELQTILHSEKDIKLLQKNIDERTEKLQCIPYGNLNKLLKLQDELPYFSLYNYYPTNIDTWEPNEKDWNVRNLIWNFKANILPDEENISNIWDIKKNKNAMATLNFLSCLQRCIELVLGDYVQDVIFVCLPASTETIYNIRYNYLTTRLFSRLKIQNGNDYVYYKAEGSARHLGGNKAPDISIDSCFFRDKTVVIFDDIITSGRSMLQFKNQLESVGAKVICGISIGITRKEKQLLDPYHYIQNDLQLKDYDVL